MDTKRAISALGALAQENRLAIFRLLVERGPQGLAAGGIAGKLEIPPSSLSFHLAQLNHAGLIRQRREGRSLIYSIDFAAMDGLMGYLMDHCCGGNPGTCLPARSGSSAKCAPKPHGPGGKDDRPNALQPRKRRFS